MKPRVVGDRRTFKNPLDKGRKKISRIESIQLQMNQERNDSTQAPNIFHLPSFHPSHRPSVFSQLSQVNQGQKVPMVSPFGLSVAYYGYHQPINIYQQNSLSIRSQGSFVTSGSYFRVPGGSSVAGTSGSMNAHHLPLVGAKQASTGNNKIIRGPAPA